MNTTDCPQKDMVVQIIDGKAYYMSRAYKPNFKSYDGMEPGKKTTSLEDFGFEIIEREYQADFSLVRTSVATYEDGAPRQWQGEFKFSLPKVKL